MRIINTIFSSIDTADDKTIGKYIITIAAIGIILYPSHGIASSISGAAGSMIKTITCLCKGEGFDYKFEVNQGLSEDCSNKDLDQCDCTIDGENKPVRVPHVSWLDQDEQEVDLLCEKSHKKVKRSTDNIEKEVVKTNILSRTITGAGSVVGGAGNLVGNGVEQVGGAIGGAVSGGFHLIGKVTRGVTNFAADSVKSVGGVFEGRKTIRPKRSTDDNPTALATTTIAPISRVRRSLDSENKTLTITTTPSPRSINDAKDEIAEAGRLVQEIAELMFRVSTVMNQKDTVAEVKAELYSEFKDEEHREIIDGMLENVTDNDLTREVSVTDVVTSTKDSTKLAKRTGWQSIKHIGDELAEADNVYEFTNKLVNDNSLGENEKKFANFLKDGLTKESQCGSFSKNTKATTWSTITDVVKTLKGRLGLCGDEPGLQDLIDALERVPEPHSRNRRSTDPYLKAKKKIKKKPIRPRKHRRAPKVHVQEEHPEEDHMEEDHPEEEDEAEDMDITPEGGTCRCDPDTGKPLN